MKKIIVLLVVLLGLLKADEGIQKLVIDLTTSDVITFENRVLKAVVMNKSYYESVFKELDVIVVIHGGSYRFFVKDLAKTIYRDDEKVAKASKNLKVRIESLMKTYNVKFQMCKVGMRKNKLTENNIYDFVEIIPSAMVGLINAQNDGFAYVPVN